MLELLIEMFVVHKYFADIFISRSDRINAVIAVIGALSDKRFGGAQETPIQSSQFPSLLFFLFFELLQINNSHRRPPKDPSDRDNSTKEF